MIEYATSDWHLKPGDVFPNCIDLPSLAIVGDLLDILPLGMGAWRTPEGHRTCASINDSLPNNHIVLLGNHEGRLEWLEELLEEPFGIRVARSFQTGKRHFEHGHKFTEWRVLSWAADDVVEWLTSNDLTRKAWYWFCKRQNWIPSTYANPGDKYQEIVGAYWAMVLAKAHKEDMTYVVGHSHQACEIETEFGVRLIDLGAKRIHKL